MVGKKSLHASTVNESLQSLLRNNSQSRLFLPLLHSYNCFSARTEYIDSVSTSISSYLSVWQKFVALKVVIEPQDSQFSVAKDKEDNSDCVFMFDFRFGFLYLVKLVDDMYQSPERFFVDRCMCLLFNRVLCNGMATAIHILTAKRAVCQQLHRFCNNIGIGVLVSMTASIDSGLHKHIEEVYMMYSRKR